MNALHERALRALGWKEAPIGYWEDEKGVLVRTINTLPSEAELIGLLMLELDRLTARNFAYYGFDNLVGGLQVITLASGQLVESDGIDILSVFVKAVEAAKGVK
jgi:hypothetical protein